MSWLETIRRWFSEEIKSSDMIIDEKWQMQELNGDPDRFAVSNENLPFEIGVYIKEEFANINVYTNLSTSDWEIKDQRDIYHDLLIQNKKNLFVKYYLTGENDTVALRTELDLEYLNKKEFNDAFQAVIRGSMWLLQKMGLLEENLCEEGSEQELENKILKMLDKGMKKHAIIKNLIEERDMDPEEATERVFNLVKDEEENNHYTDVSR